MAFIESPIFPLTVSFGARMGPSFDTDIVEVESGKEYRNQNWDQPRQKGRISLLASRAQRMAIFRQWVYTTNGRARGFRVRDVNDYEVPDLNGSGVVLQVSGSNYQTYKRYMRGSEYFDRKITKPEVGTLALYDVTTSGSTLKLLHTHYELDESRGAITISFTPDGVLEWTGRFHVPCRFDLDEVEFESINREGDNYIQGMDEIPLIELRDE